MRKILEVTWESGYAQRHKKSEDVILLIGPRPKRYRGPLLCGDEKKDSLNPPEGTYSVTNTL